MMPGSRLLPLALLMALAPPAVHAEDTITIVTPGERPTENKLLLGGLGAGAAVVSGLGLYFHLDGKSASDKVASDVFGGEAWTADDAALFAQAERSRTRAIVAYSVGGALLVGAVVALIVTEPPSETTVLRPRAARAVPTVVPAAGGAVLGGMWSF